MFGSDKNKSARTGGGVETLIGPRVVIRGDVHFSGGLYIEGRIEGSVLADEADPTALVTLSERGSIEGEVRAPHVIVNGQLHGDIYSSQRIELAAAARVEGNVHYNSVEMVAGSMLTGRLIHQQSEPKRLSGPDKGEA
ncbi:polymer-forming cytoskeletal protein [Aquimonas sp.]|jgi:cytoskeletal protein CcmA (bactofilin family)|uniref:bactofilin family protein n=1 Tax=Aquimonas sp. TaxID=1872588 RepID=UPI0037C095B7